MRLVLMLFVSTAFAHAGAIPLAPSSSKNPAPPTTDSYTVSDMIPSEKFNSAQPIPYLGQPFFADNRVGGADVKLPPLPPSLYPVPPPERRPSPVILPPPTLSPMLRPEAPHASAIPKTATPSAATTPAAPGPGVVLGTADTPTQNIAVSPFVNWITKNPDAADIARRAQREYSINGVAENSLGADDLFYNIRFPYTGAADTPPGSSAVIYSTPKH